MTEAADRAWEMMKSIGFCALVTKTGDGRLHGRPMTALVRKDDGKVYILAEKSEAAVREAEANGDALLTFSNGPAQNVCLNGEAKVSGDRALIRRLWNSGAQAYFPKGPEDPEVVAIAVDPGACEYWDGPNKAVMVAKMAYAVATGGTPDIGENKRVNL